MVDFGILMVRRDYDQDTGDDLPQWRIFFRSYHDESGRFFPMFDPIIVPIDEVG